MKREKKTEKDVYKERIQKINGQVGAAMRLVNELENTSSDEHPVVEIIPAENKFEFSDYDYISKSFQDIVKRIEMLSKGITGKGDEETAVRFNYTLLGALHSTVQHYKNHVEGRCNALNKQAKLLSEEIK